MSEIENIEVTRATCARAQPSYARLATEIRDILEMKLAEAGLSPVSITYRAKTIESFAVKITRKHTTTRSRK